MVKISIVLEKPVSMSVIAAALRAQADLMETQFTEKAGSTSNAKMAVTAEPASKSKSKKNKVSEDEFSLDDDTSDEDLSDLDTDEDDEKELTLEDVRTALHEYSEENSKEEAVKMLKKIGGVTKVKDLSPKKYAQLIDALK